SEEIGAEPAVSEPVLVGLPAEATAAPAPAPVAAAKDPVREDKPVPAPKPAASAGGGGGGAGGAAGGGGGDKKEGGGGGAKGAETIRVAVDTIERIMQLVSELVLNRNQLLELTRNRENDTVKAPLQRLSGLTTDLQDAVMRARMQPVGRLFSGLPRL